MIYAVIMAGGVGKRFWPLSTPKTPKQLLALFDDKTMISLTLDRILPLIPMDRVRIVTVAEQVPLFQKALPQLNAENFIVEPLARNTAPCIGLAAAHLLNEDPDAIMVVLPADHLIKDEERFRACLQTGIEAARSRDAIVTVGIEPSRPETGYGYIQFDQEEISHQVHSVVTFAEKPSLDTAKNFIDTGEFLWNSGIFIWSARRIMAEIEEYIPELFAALEEIRSCFGGDNESMQTESSYRSIKPISIDYGVMEHSKYVLVVRGDFDWSDVGSWEEVYRISEHDESGNSIHGSAYALECTNSLIFTDEDHPLAVYGLDNVIVVNTANGALVVPRDKVQEVKQLAETVFKSRGI